MNSKAAPILSIRNVSKSFPGVHALNNVSIDIQRGSTHGIVGENGAGKSTLMKILSGVYTKDSGEIIFDGETIEKTTPAQSLDRGLSIVYQELNLVNTLSIGENIFLGRLAKAGGMKGAHQQAGELLKSIGFDISTHTLISSLSVSEKQMVEIAKALSFHSKVIIMDEPSSSLTADEMKRLGTIIHKLHEDGISIIYISHKLDEIFEFCDTVTIMRDGCVIQTSPVSEMSRKDMVAKMVGRPIENEYPERFACNGETAFEVKGLNTRKLKDISFSVRNGEILGLVGLVGAGRTEIARAIFGADHVHGMELTLDGKSLVIRSPRDAIDAGIALVPEDRKQQGLILSYSVRENISLAALRSLRRGIFLQGSSQDQMAKNEVEALSIKTPSIQTRVESLSGGNQQKCVLARWLELHPRLLILDEPTRGIDVGAKYEIYLLIQKIVEQGSMVILISSELPEVLNLSHRVLTISNGRITGEFDPATASSAEIMEKAIV